MQERPVQRLDVPIKVKGDYGISSHRGQKVHIIRDARCHWSTYKPLHARRSGNDQFPWAIFEARWLCKSTYTAWPIIVANPAGMAEGQCRQCLENVVQFGDGSIVLARNTMTR